MTVLDQWDDRSHKIYAALRESLKIFRVPMKAGVDMPVMPAKRWHEDAIVKEGNKSTTISEEMKGGAEEEN